MLISAPNEDILKNRSDEVVEGGGRIAKNYCYDLISTNSELMP